MQRRPPIRLLGPMPPMPPLEPHALPVRLKILPAVMAVAVCSGIVLAFLHAAALESGVLASTAQLRGEEDALAYVRRDHPEAIEMRAQCVVGGGSEMPCTVTGREGQGRFSESIRCRTSIAVGPRGCGRSVDRTITVEQAR